jgi:spore coat polysaccharide biosynthesis protein SpsF
LQIDTFATLFDAYTTSPADYIAYGFAGGQPTIQTHLGLFSELTTTKALQRIAVRTENKRYLEHVTNYLYTHPDSFSIRLLSLPDYLEGRFDLRFTLDTPEDFILLQQLYTTFREDTDGSIPTLLQLVESHPDYYKRMLHNIAQNKK